MRLLERLAARRKNRAIREGRWHSRQFETYESALSNAKALVDAILGKEIDKKYRDGWDDDIVGDGSQNHPLLGAACEFWYQRTRNLPKMTAVLDAWLRYSRLHYMTGETYSSFIYGLWIHGAILTVAFGARLVGRHDVADALYGIMRTGYSLWALGCSGDDWGGSHPGKAVAWAGSRSWITKKDDDGNYYDRDGVLLEPYNVDTTFATNFLAAALGWAAPKKWLGDLVAAMATVDPAEPWGLSETDKGTLRLVALAQEPLEQLDAFDRVVGWLEAADPLPAIPCRVVKTRQWVGFFALFSIHPFSTSFLYARIWFKDGRPVGIWWDNLWPGIDRRAGWFNVDPSVRKAGVHGYLEVADVGGAYELVGERAQGKSYDGNHIPPDSFYYELAGGHRDPGAYLPGPRVIRLPYSERVYDVGFGPDGAEVHWPQPGNGNGEEDCSEIPNWLERIWCYIRKWLGL